MGCFAMTEVGHGSNVQALGTAATYDPETREFVITTPDESARKDWIGNAARHAELAVVFAQLEVGGTGHGVHALVVPLRRDGARCCPAITHRGRRPEDGPQRRRQRPDHVRRGAGAAGEPLDQFADVTPEGEYRSSIENPNRRFFTMLGTLVQGRVCVGGAGINAAKVALAIAVKYGDRRRQFEATDPPAEDLLLDYGLHQRRLFPLLARTYALHFAQEVVAEQLHDVFSSSTARPRAMRTPAGSSSRGRPGRRRSAPGTPPAPSRSAGRRAAAQGYRALNRFAALKADTDVFTTFEGDNHVLLQLVAKGLLTDYAGEFEDLDQFGMVRFVAGLAVETVIEKTSVHTLIERIRDVLPGGDQWDQEAGLLDPNYHRMMLRFREEHMLAGVARRLKRGIDDGLNPGEVFSRVQDHVIATASAHAERLVLDAFLDKVAALDDGDQKVALNLLCDLFALTTIEADRGVVHGARPAVVPALQGDQPRGQRPVPQAPPARRRPGRRVRRTRRDAAFPRARRLSASRARTRRSVVSGRRSPGSA